MNFKGKNVLVLTATGHYWLGECISITGELIELKKSGWVACVGRHNQVLGTGNPGSDTEFEPHPPNVTMALPGTKRGSVVIEWPHELWTNVI
jgi:hypothetical protein